MSQPLIELAGVTKSFGATRALDDVSFEAVAGEVHVVAGENGAGKSTLLEILSGAIRDFSGRRVVRAPVAAIHQELSLVGPLSVADNLALGDRAPLLSPRRASADRRRARRVLDAAGLKDVDPLAPVESLPIGVRQQIEIARALEQQAGVILMDEPTSALGENEADRLLERVRELAAQGKAIVYISHRMEEMFRVADRITVLCDGRRVLSAPANELDRDALVHAMLGRELSGAARRQASVGAETALEVRGLGLSDPARPERRLLSDVSFAVRRGEIVGVFGSLGSGASTLLHALFGALEPGPFAGTIELDAEPYVPLSPRHAIARGLILLASDRKLSLLSALSVADNVTLSSLERFVRRGLVDRRAQRAASDAMLAQLSIRGARDAFDPAGWLSGGNQQKVALARCLVADPRVLLLDEPTRGVDIGAKADVYAKIWQLAERGLAIVLVSSELEELLALADRVIVLYRGRIVDEIEARELSRERLLASAMGGREAAS